jgi:hypothetical protein
MSGNVLYERKGTINWLLLKPCEKRKENALACTTTSSSISELKPSPLYAKNRPSPPMYANNGQ